MRVPYDRAIDPRRPSCFAVLALVADPVGRTLPQEVETGRG